MDSGAAAEQEVSGAGRTMAGVYDEIQRRLPSCESAAMAHLQAHSGRLMRDLGVTYPVEEERSVLDEVVPFDPFPRVLSAEEWTEISRGILQRVSLWNAFLRDIYTTQEVLRAGIIPHQWVYDDPAYHRSSVGLRPAGETYVHVAAFDLVQDDRGRWRVMEDHISHTTGAVPALQSRQVLTQVCPTLLEAFAIRRNADYPTELLEHLRQHAPSGAFEQRVALIAPGMDDPGYAEHSYLARLMGAPLVHGFDLLVLNSKLYLKTIGGLEPIDVLYRLMDHRKLDPLEFPAHGGGGVSGLMMCLRKRSLTVANALGAGLGDNRAIASRMHRLARFYSNAPLLLPTWQRWVCSDPDERELVLGNTGTYRILAVSPHGPSVSGVSPDLANARPDCLREAIAAEPSRYVAEPVAPLNLLPVCQDGRLVRRHAGLRVFALGGVRPRMAAWALTRYAIVEGACDLALGRGGGLKDTWVLGGAEDKPKEAPIIISSVRRRLRLGSRIADSLYWMGRYIERAENSTRILKTLQGIQWEAATRDEPQRWVPLWEALARATGHPTQFFHRSSLPEKQSVSHYLLLNRRNPSSVLNCLARSRHNAQSIREAVPPEVWSVLTRLWQILEQALAKRDGPLLDRLHFVEIQELQDRILTQIDALTGAASKNMLRGDGWQFWSMGIFVERALTTLHVMRQMLMRRQNAAGVEEERDQSHLDVLLGMLSCRYAYRSLYQARLDLYNAARMILQDPQMPHSVLFCLLEVRQALTRAGGLSAEPQEDEAPTPLRRCARLISEVEFADLKPFFDGASQGRRGPRLRTWLDRLSGELALLSNSISDYHMHHQTFNVVR